MKEIVSLFISAYQPGMASIECQLYSLNQSRQPLLFSNSNAGWPNEELDSSEDDCFEDARFEKPNYKDLCWMISRARREESLGYYMVYLRYASHHSGYARTVETSLRQHIALHSDLQDSFSTFFVT